MTARYIQVPVPTADLEWRSSAIGQSPKPSRSNNKRCSIASMDPEVAAYLKASSFASQKARGPYTERKRPRGVARPRSREHFELQGTVAGHRRDSKASYRMSIVQYTPAPVILETSHPSRPLSPSRPLPPTPSHYRTTSISSETSLTSSSSSSSSSSRLEKSLPPPPPAKRAKTHSRTGSTSSYDSAARRTDIDITTPAQTPLPPPPRRRVGSPTSPTPTPPSRLSTYQPQNQAPSLMNGIKTVWKRATTRVRHMPLPGKLRGRRGQQRESVVWDGFDRVVQYDVNSRPRHPERRSGAVRNSRRISGLYVPVHRDSMGTTRSSRIGVAL